MMASQRWTPYQLIIVITMVITGSINTLSVKWANTIYARDIIGQCVPFNHPFLQSFGMFLGESFCLGAFYVSLCWANKKSARSCENTEDKENTGSGSRNCQEAISEKKNDPELKPFSLSKAYILFPAALFDMMGICVMYVALTLTSASSFQMLTGAVILFTGVNSMIFLKQRLAWFRWLGMLFIIGGLAIIGAADFLQSDDASDCEDINATTVMTTLKINVTTLSSTSSENITVTAEDEYGCDQSSIIPTVQPPCGNSAAGYIGGIPKKVVGDLLVIISQIFVSFWVVYEEKVISKYSIAPLQAVGIEGVFGFILMVLVMICFNYVPTYSPNWGHSPGFPYYLEDALDGFYQLFHSGLLLFSFVLMVFSMALFNFAGITVTKELSATTRMVLDTVRTLVIWVFSLALRWQKFQYLQPIGFMVLLTGMCLYNDLVIRPGINSIFRRNSSE